MTVKICKCFIASPNDTLEERAICDKVFAEINKNIGDAFGFRVESLKWEKDVRPGIGKDAQDVINQQVGDDYDIFIGIMYKKFGTPTSNAGSGTEEEFNNAYERHIKKEPVEIMFYFNDAPVKQSSITPTELEKINCFKSKISGLGGLYWTYESITDFEEKLRSHINNFCVKNYGVAQETQNYGDINFEKNAKLKALFKTRLDSALTMFSAQPLTWVEPILSSTNEISCKIQRN